MGSNRFDLIMGGALSDYCRWRRRELRHELPQIRAASVDSYGFVHILSQEIEHFGPLLHRQVDAWIGSASIGTHGDEIAVLLVGGINLLEARRQIELIAGADLVHGAADGPFDVDGRVQAALRKTARQHDVTVEYGPRGIGDGIVLIIAFRQNRIERGDRTDAAVAVAGALDQLRQAREYRRRISLGRRRLADGQR